MIENTVGRGLHHVVNDLDGHLLDGDGRPCQHAFVFIIFIVGLSILPTLMPLALPPLDLAALLGTVGKYLPAPLVKDLDEHCGVATYDALECNVAETQNDDEDDARNKSGRRGHTFVAAAASLVFEVHAFSACRAEHPRGAWCAAVGRGWGCNSRVVKVVRKARYICTLQAFEYFRVCCKRT